MNITPDQARELLDGASDGPWEHGDVPGPGEDPTRATEVYQPGEPGAIAYVQPNTADVKLIAATPDLAQTIAGMEWQWSVERLTEYGSRWLIDRPWTCDRELAETWLRKYDGSRLVRRLVGPVEEAE